MNKLTVASVPEIEDTLPRTYVQLALDTKPSVVVAVSNVNEIVPIVIQLALSLLTSTKTEAAPVLVDVCPEAWNVLLSTGMRNAWTF
jgi:hypothetical protein